MILTFSLDSEQIPKAQRGSKVEFYWNSIKSVQKYKQARKWVNEQRACAIILL